jgi:hypothetical protein
MAPLWHAPRKENIKFADEIFALDSKTRERLIFPGDVKALVKDLLDILDVVEKAASEPQLPYRSLTFHEQLDIWQEEVDWKQCKTRLSPRVSS